MKLKLVLCYTATLLTSVACFDVNTLVNTVGEATAPLAITSDNTNLYVADPNTHVVYKIEISSGTKTDIAGSSGTAGNTNGTGAVARFNTPSGIAKIGNDLYISDKKNHRIRKIDMTGDSVTTFVGAAQGATDGIGTAGRFKTPGGIVTDGTDLFVADTGNHRVRKIVVATATVSTLAGSSAGSDDGTGTAAKFSSPTDLEFFSNSLYIADFGNHTLREIVISTAVVTTFLGSAGNSGETNGSSAITRFNNPWGLATDGTHFYVADFGNHQIRQVVISSKTTSRLLGSLGKSQDRGDGGNALDAETHEPGGIEVVGGKVYFANHQHIRKIE